MIQLVVANGNTAYGIYEYSIDSIEDLEKLPARAKMGSEATIISTNETYVKNGNNQWILKQQEQQNIKVETISEDDLVNAINEIFDEEGETL